MEFESIHSQVDRWFAQSSTRMMYVTPRDIDDALAEQENLEKNIAAPFGYGKFWYS